METTVERHDRMVRAEREQAERLRNDRGGNDIWKGRATRFAVPGAEPPVVSVLADLTTADARVIDVGAGGGRITVPLARRVQEMVAVEPSAAMRDVLNQEIGRREVANINVIPQTWADSDVEPADLVFAAHVTYGISDIEPFLGKIDASATQVAVLVTFTDPAQHVLAPFWKHVYGEDRLRLPCKDEVLDVLRELGAEPQVSPVDKQEVRAFGTLEETREHLMHRLFIGQGSAFEQRLDSAIARLTAEKDGQIWPIDVRPNQQSVIWWRPMSHG